MKHYSLPVILLFLIFTTASIAQDLYEPRNIQKTYTAQTRSRTGEPGVHYWQNQADYHINIQVTPPNRSVKGSETISYTNHSPDTLKQLNFKLILNHHKPGAPRSGAVPEDYLTSGIHIDKFIENGKEGEWNENEMDATNKFVKLNEPLLPGSSVKFEIDWHYELSKQSGREGAISENTFFIAYFYPRIAVYDDYEGWDVTPHTLSQEFYNDINNYVFEVDVPKDYLVWATGELQNPAEVLQKEFADRFEKSKTSDEVIQIVSQNDLENKPITQQNNRNTWKWKASEVSDIAIAVSNEYKWDAASIVVDDRRVSTQAAYDEPATDFEQMVDNIQYAINWFSTEWPGVAYPYSSMTVVRGFADMEYPMMANDSSDPERPEVTRFVAAHEIAHTYFPFYMGTNETRFGFMDEGWVTAFEYLIGIDDRGKEVADQSFKGFRVNRWRKDPSFEGDLPIITPTNVLSGRAMGINEYGKPALAYLALKDLLGDQVFKKALHGYMDRWKSKHPMPWDFFYSFNDLTGQNLNWFWNNWFFSTNHIDLKIDEVTTKGNDTFVHIKNEGGFVIPFKIEVELQDGSTKSFSQSVKQWQNHEKALNVKLEGISNPKSIKVSTGIFMDADSTNNDWTK